MYSFNELVSMLTRKFASVPNVEQEDIEMWLESAYAEHGVTRTTNVPPQFASLLMLHAEATGTGQIAYGTAHYFSFSDKDEEVDKSMISEGYLKVSKQLWERYDHRIRYKIEGYSPSNVKYMRRLDRRGQND